MTESTKPQRKQIDVTIRLTERRDAPAILLLNKKFVEEGTLIAPLEEAMLLKVIDAKESVVAERKDDGVIVGFNLRRSKTPGDDMKAQIACVKRLVSENKIESFDKAAFGSQTAIDHVAQGSNVQRELVMGLAENAVKVHGQSHIIFAVLKSNEKSLHISVARDGCSIVDDTDEKVYLLMSSDLRAMFC